MDKPLGYLLCCQSPALFLGAAALLVSFFVRRRSHRVRAALDLVFTVACLAGGVGLYYLGMLYEHFTIHDFWQIRVPGWIGLVLAAVLIVALIIRSIGKAAERRRAAREAARAEDARQQELENAKNTAYASGQADAMAVGRAADVVAQAKAPAAPEPSEVDPSGQDTTFAE